MDTFRQLNAHWAELREGLLMLYLARILVVVLLLAVIAFCIFGFLATFEPMEPESQLTWRIIYVALVGNCAAAIVWLFLLRRKSS
jgi:hypothetical protein